MVTCRWILIHMGGQVPIKVTWILETDKLNRMAAGAHFYPVAIRQSDRYLTVYRKDRLLVGVDGDADRRALSQNDGAIDREMRGHRNQ